MQYWRIRLIIVSEWNMYDTFFWYTGILCFLKANKYIYILVYKYFYQVSSSSKIPSYVRTRHYHVRPTRECSKRYSCISSWTILRVCFSRLHCPSDTTYSTLQYPTYCSSFTVVQVHPGSYYRSLGHSSI